MSTKTTPLVDHTASAKKSTGASTSDKRPATPMLDLKMGQDRKPLSQKSTNTNNATPNLSPRFMSPTVASVHSKTTPNSLKENSRKATETPASTGSSKKGSWMSSAAKRVAFGKSGESAPRSTKEAEKSKPVTKTTPPEKDNADKNPYSRLNSADKANLKDKPLPSPPAATVLSTNEFTPSRTLLDATEAPLKRSPTNAGGLCMPESEWPALLPKTANNADPVHKTIRGTQSADGLRAAERYPSQKGSLMAVSEDGSPSVIRKPITKRDDSVSDMSAPGSTPAKPADEKTPNFSFPRQTRTSALRAKISANVVSAGSSSNAKSAAPAVDSPAVKETREGGRTLHKSSKASKQPSRPGSGLSRKSPSRPSVRFQGRNPAKMVAGSRRPEGHRPSSRSSTRDKASSDAETKDDTPLIQAVNEPNRIVPMPDRQPSDKPRSSLPKRRAATFSKADVSSTNAEGGQKGQPGPEPRPVVDPGFAVYEDRRLHNDKKDGQASNSMSKKDVANSMAQVYHTRQVKSDHPDLAPTMKIAEEADCVILGVSCPDEVPQPLVTKASKSSLKKDTGLHRRVVKNEFRKSKDADHQEIPSPTEGPNPIDTKVIDLTSPDAKDEKCDTKAKSADKETLKNLGEDCDPFVDQKTRPQSQPETSKHAPAYASLISDYIAGEIPAEKEFYCGLEVAEPVHAPASKVVSKDNNSKSPLSPVMEKGGSPTTKSTVATQQTSPQATQATGKPVQHQDKQRQYLGPPHRTTSSETKPKVSAFPPRASSRMPPIEPTIKPPAIPKKDTIAPPRVSKDFPEIQNQLGSSKGHGSVQVALQPEDEGKKAEPRRRSKSMLSISNLKGLFRRGSAEPLSGHRATKATKSSSSKNVVGPTTTISGPEDKKSRLLTKQSTVVTNTTITSNGTVTGNARPANDVEITKASGAAMHILETARQESDPSRKERLLEIGKVMVDAITHAQEAEKAMEEAKVAADKAEMSFMLTKKKVLDVIHYVDEWAGIEKERERLRVKARKSPGGK
ncbi:MAG: hypothetical protein M4579_005091 [Chaenotheca gracillima]|nr:MAG: hypothetical protein M4579_005091 [Chaenotheca gracillima]